MINSFTSKNYYERLNVSRDADKAQITKAYHEIATVFHPDSGLYDKNGGDLSNTHLEIFKCIGEAYSVLSDDAKRVAYDAKLKIEENKPTIFRKQATEKQKDTESSRANWQSVSGANAEHKRVQDEMLQKFRERESVFEGGGEIRSSLNISSINVSSIEQRSSVVRSAVFEGAVSSDDICKGIYEDVNDENKDSCRSALKERVLCFIRNKSFKEDISAIASIVFKICVNHADAVIIIGGLGLGAVVFFVLFAMFV